MVEYSEKEKQMIAYFGLDDIIECIQPPVMYRLMVDRAFKMDDRSAWSESLRRCAIAFDSAPTLYRLTPEWDEMIQI